MGFFILGRYRRECDLVVKGGSDHGEKGYLYDVASGLFRGNRSHDAPLSDASPDS